MKGSICKIMGLGSEPLTSGVELEVITSGNSIRETCAAMIAVYYWSVCCKAAGANGRDVGCTIPANSFGEEVWGV